MRFMIDDVQDPLPANISSQARVGLPVNKVPAGRVCQTLLSLSASRFYSKGIFAVKFLLVLV